MKFQFQNLKILVFKHDFWGSYRVFTEIKYNSIMQKVKQMLELPFKTKKRDLVEGFSFFMAIFDF